MPLTSDDDANVAQLMKWLRDPEAPSEAVNLREELAYLLFYGDPTWASNDDSSSIADYRSILSSWFEGDPSAESEFVQRTDPEKAVGCEDLTAWFAPVVTTWKEWAATAEGNVKAGIRNDNFDGTPGTEYYWYDADNEVYLYASTEDAPDDAWFSYEEYRYSPVGYDGDRKTNYRQDKVTQEYEFQSRATPMKWLTPAGWAAEASAAAAKGLSPGQAEGPVYTAPVYDAGYQMYWRYSAERGYEYAADPASATWLTQAEADQRLHPATTALDQPDAVGPPASGDGGELLDAGVLGEGLAAEAGEVADSMSEIREQLMKDALRAARDAGLVPQLVTEEQWVTYIDGRMVEKLASV